MWGRPLPTWINDSETGTACTLVSGVIMRPITRLIRTVYETPGLAALKGSAEQWIDLCRETVQFHDPEWVEFPDGSGMHLEPYGKGPRRVYPRGGSRVNPLNRQFVLGMSMLNLALATGDEEYLRKVAMMARFFRNTSEITERTFVWEYLAGAYPSTGEDISHAHVQVHFAELCAAAGVVITEVDLRRIANTFADNVFRHGDVPCGNVRGGEPGLHLAVATWAGLCRFRPEVFPKVEAVVEAVFREDRMMSLRDGWGIRNLTCLEKARRLLQH